MKKRHFLFIFAILTLVLALSKSPLQVNAANNNNLIDDGVFDKSSSMSAAQIDSWLNGFANSCISPNSGFTAPDPTGYSPDANFVDGHYSYGSAVTAGRVVYDAAVAHGINPQVLLTKLQNEEQLVDGSAGCPDWRFASATGYSCTDGGAYGGNYSYTGADPYANGAVLVTPLYYRNGVAHNSISGSCVQKNVKAGFSQQVVHAAWFLSVYRHKAEGDVGWASVHGSWNHCEDNNSCPTNFNIPARWSCYSGPMTQGDYKLCTSDTTTHFFDGYTPIDGVSVHIDNGGTAVLYYYTPHLQSFNSIFTNYFGSAYDVYSWSVVSQSAYTDQTKATPVDLTNLLVGQKTYIGFKAKNTGDVTWTNTGSNPVRTGTSSPKDRNSAFCDTSDSPSWLGCARPTTMIEPSVAPGQTATFEFWYKAPSQAGTYDERFNLLAEGLKWMNDPGLYFHTVVKPPIYTWSLQSQYAYTDQTKATPVNLTSLQPSQKVFIGFTAKNTGNVTWINSGANPVRIGTSSPQDRTSLFCDASWLSCSRPAALKEASVAPGQNGTFEFWYQAPQTPGSYREHFNPLVEGSIWMNDLRLNYDSAVRFSTAGTTSSLGPNQPLNSGQTLVSADGRYRLVMQGDGNLVIYSINRALWSTNTAGHPGARTIMQGDGNLVVYDTANKPLWFSGTAGSGQSNLLMQTDGNLVIYNSSKATWASHTNGQF
jgi:hypothetical protein